MLTANEIREIRGWVDCIREVEYASQPDKYIIQLLSHIDELSQKLPCGHPIQCLREVDTGNLNYDNGKLQRVIRKVCGWCEDMK